MNEVVPSLKITHDDMTTSYAYEVNGEGRRNCANGKFLRVRFAHIAVSSWLNEEQIGGHRSSTNCVTPHSAATTSNSSAQIQVGLVSILPLIGATS